MENPLPDYRYFLPIRVKGRNLNQPEWDKLEILKNGTWFEYSI